MASLRDIVYTLLMCVPPGCTITYGALAELVGSSPRAIGRIMAANRSLIVVPCHRVVGSKGLGGFSRGIGFKQRLLELEGALVGGRLRCVIRSAADFWRFMGDSGFEVDV